MILLFSFPNSEFPDFNFLDTQPCPTWSSLVGLRNRLEKLPPQSKEKKGKEFFPSYP